MSDLKPPDIKIPDKVDPKVLLVAVAIGGTVALTLVSDQVTFARKPTNVAEAALTLLPVAGYRLFEDRIYADVFAGLIYMVVLAMIVLAAYRLLDYYVVTPAFYKKMFKERQREQELANQYDKGTT